MRRIERLHAISEDLRRSAPRTVSARQLAERYGVSRRTIERDVDALRMAGLPLYGQVGRTGGTAIVAPSAHPATRSLVSLTTAEIVSLAIAAHAVQGAPYAVGATTAIGKLMAQLDEPQRIAADALRQRLRLADAAPVVRPRVLSVVEDAVRTQTVVRITYVDRDGARTRRDVEPTGFYASPQQWSLIGWCRLRRDGRLFRLDRIRRADPTAQPCEPRDVDEVLGWVPQPGRAP